MKNKENKKLFIETLGCAMNVRDSEHLINELNKKENYVLTTDLKEADLILLNTCSVREKPELKLFSQIGQFAKIKKKDAKIGVCGCTASALGKKILQKSPHVNFVLGARNISKISQIIYQDKAVEVDLDYDDSTYMFSHSKNVNFKGMINISIGCDKKCSYCIVPFTRGNEISIPFDLILKEAKKMVSNGVKEILFLGQNVNNYGLRFTHPHRKINFTNLLSELSQINGLERIRFTSPHPLHMNNEFIDELARNDKICKSLHMPLQSGSSKILKLMRRGYTKEWFKDRIDYIKYKIPQIALSTDIIVAFPYEEEEDFNDTLDVLNYAKFDTLYSFIYSPREHTLSYSWGNEGKIENEIAKNRLKRLQNAHKQILMQNSKNEINKIHKILIENNKKNEIEVFSEGKTDTNRLVKIKDSFLDMGSFVEVKIKEVINSSLIGEVI